MKRERVAIRIECELRAIADRYAAEQNRTVSNYIEHLLRSDLKRRGVKVPLTRFERLPVRGTAIDEKTEGNQ